MKDITKRIFEKENQAEVSNNVDKRNNNKSVTQLVSLTYLNRQPKVEFKSIDLKNYQTQRTNTTIPNIQYHPETKQKTATDYHSPIKNRQQASLSLSSNIPKEPYKQTPQNALMHHYGDPILEHYLLQDEIQKCEFLKKHTIGVNLRAKMVDWMVEVLTSYKCRDQTFFLAVRLMDTFLQKSNKQHAPQDLHLVGVTCMFMASKFEEIYPIKLQIVHDKIAHKKLSKEDIREKESQITLALDFNLVGVTLYEILTLILSNFDQKVNEVAIFLAKMILYDYELISQYGYSLLVTGCAIAATQLLQNDIEITYINNVNKEEAQELSKKIINIFRNFDKLYPHLENLKKFNKAQNLIGK